MKLLALSIFTFVLLSCNNGSSKLPSPPEFVSNTSLIVLGTIQDAGLPHIACQKSCCIKQFLNQNKTRKVVSLGIVDSENRRTYIFEATPDLPAQMKLLKNHSGFDQDETPDGIFITHAHIGHYTGLMYLGKEAMNANGLPVYAMPKMKIFLEQNGPWSQLVSSKNISIKAINAEIELSLTKNISVIPFAVPHRDEYSETVGYTIVGPKKRVLFIPDIDKWEKWEKDIVGAISEVNYAFIDGTFYNGIEINNRDISEIPHPFIIESMAIFKNLSAEEKKKIHFIHFNHTNPVISPKSKQAEELIGNGFNIAKVNDVFYL